MSNTLVVKVTYADDPESNIEFECKASDAEMADVGKMTLGEIFCHPDFYSLTFTVDLESVHIGLLTAKKDVERLKVALGIAERDLDVFNILNPIIAMGSGKWDEHGKLMNRVANARRALKEAQQEGLRCTRCNSRRGIVPWAVQQPDLCAECESDLAREATDLGHADESFEEDW